MHSLFSVKPAEPTGGGYSWPLTYEDIISIENLLDAWREFVRGKRQRIEVQEFERHLMRNVLALHEELKSGVYKHGGYHHFRPRGDVFPADGVE